MLNCQNHLILHLQRGFPEPTVRTIKEYAGDLKDANKLTQLLPAILVIFIDGRPAAQEPDYEFDLLIVVQNPTLEKLVSQQSNLDLVSQVAAYLEANYLIRAQARNGSYEIIRETMTAQTILNDARFNIVSLKIFVKDHTK